MNLYFRLIWLLVRLSSMPKLKNPLDIASLTLRVYPNDLDLNFHVNNGRYLTIMDLGRIQLMGVLGLLTPIRKNKWLPVVGSIKIHFLKSLNLFDKFTLTTQVIYWDEKWFYMEQKIFKNNELCVIALIKGLFTSKDGKISPETLFSTLPHPPGRPPLPRVLKYWIEAEKASLQE